VSLFDFADLVAGFATGTYTVTRAPSPSLDAEGRAVPSPSTVLVIVASVQPLSGRELERLPESFRGKETRKLYTATQLRTEGEGFSADRIAIDGASWQVEGVEDFSAAGYFKALVTKEPPP
jgi:hypothetical protein